MALENLPTALGIGGLLILFLMVLTIVGFASALLYDNSLPSSVASLAALLAAWYGSISLLAGTHIASIWTLRPLARLMAL